MEIIFYQNNFISCILFPLDIGGLALKTPHGKAKLHQEVNMEPVVVSFEYLCWELHAKFGVG